MAHMGSAAPKATSKATSKATGKATGETAPEGQARTQARPRHFLILQGLGTPLYARLTAKLLAQGDRVSRVYYCGGDWFFRGEDDPVDFADKAENLPRFYADLFDRLKPDVLILFGDQRAIHKPAVALARQLDITLYVLEEGYLRPGFFTFERDGANMASNLPRDPDALLRLAAAVADYPAPPAFPPPMRDRVIRDFKHIGGTLLLRRRFPYFKTHRPYSKTAEFWGWTKRILSRPVTTPHAKRTWARYAQTKPRYFFFPLQLNADTQIRVHSDFGGIEPVIDHVLHSFAADAPGSHRLLIKNHPLDNGVIPYARLIREASERLGISDRVDFIDGGDANPMIAASEGVVLVNSTVGLSALGMGRPVFTLGHALYAIEGLVAKGTLSQFWADPMIPDAALADALMRVLKGACLLEGDVFTDVGIEAAVESILSVLNGQRPRLVRAPDAATGSKPDTEKVILG